MSALSPLQEAVVVGDWDKAAELTTQEVKSGRQPQEILGQDLQPAMDVVGQKFSSGEYFLPDMLMAARAMTNAVEVLKPLLGQSGVATIGKIAIGTVKGDVHDIGKNMVVMFLKGTGFDVLDLGVDVPTERLVEEVKREKPDILGLSALLTTTMPVLDTVIQALETAGMRSAVKVIVGGAPVTQHYADLIGADGYADNAGKAAGLCKRLLAGKHNAKVKE